MSVVLARWQLDLCDPKRRVQNGILFQQYSEFCLFSLGGKTLVAKHRKLGHEKNSSLHRKAARRERKVQDYKTLGM